MRLKAYPFFLLIGLSSCKRSFTFENSGKSAATDVVDAGSLSHEVLRTKSLEILSQNCSSCHGANSRGDGGINYILNEVELVQQGKIKPRQSAEKSRIYARVLDGSMPPNRKLSSTEIAILKRWIEEVVVSEKLPKDYEVAASETCNDTTKTGVAPSRIWLLTPEQIENTVRNILGVSTSLTPLFNKNAEVLGFHNNAEMNRFNDTFLSSIRIAAQKVASDALSQKASLLTCSAGDTSNRACIETFLQNKTRLFFRREVSSSEINELLNLYDKVKTAKNSDSAFAAIIETLVQSPTFLYRTEVGASNSPSVIIPISKGGQGIAQSTHTLMPTISAPQKTEIFNSNQSHVLIKWTEVPGATGYWYRASEFTDAAKTIQTTNRYSGNTSNGPHYLYIDASTNKNTQIELPVRKGHFYNFWVHAYINGTPQVQNAVSFSVSPTEFSTTLQNTSVSNEGSQMTDYELASAIAFTLTNAGPDENLLNKAKNAQLRTPEQVRATVASLLTSNASSVGIRQFFTEFLELSKLDTISKSTTVISNLSSELKNDMKEETLRFVEDLVRNNGTLKDLYAASHTFLNLRLANHYQVSAPTTSHTTFVKTTPSGTPSGILTQASLLTVFSSASEASPIKRGKFVREKLLCYNLPEPPPGVPQLPTIDPNLSTRERFEMHSKAPQCLGCHSLIDPIGYGFLNYDPVGRYRSTDGGGAIDTRGKIVDGGDSSGDFEGVPELGELLGNSKLASSCLTTQYFRYSLGRGNYNFDRCEIAKINEAFVNSGMKLKDLIIETLSSDAFRKRK